LMQERKLTPWQAFKDLVAGPKEQPLVLRVYNPFALKPTDFVTVADVLNGVTETRYQVTEVDVYRRTIGDRTFESVDYVLQDATTDAFLTLRVSENAGTPGNKQRTILLLFPDYEGEYDEDLHKRVLPSGILELKNDQGELLARYERLNGLKEPYRADVLVLAANEPPRHESYDYWDFGRERDGREEFYFVEMNAETGVIQTWRAAETSENELSFLRRTAI
jgi:hypothetical protein